MTIDQRVSGGVTILDVRGQLTIEALQDMVLAERVRSVLKDGRRRIVLNLREVPYVDTTGLCNIIEGYVTTRRQGGVLKLLQPAPHVREVLQITRLLTIFEAFDSEADAIASFGPEMST